MSCFFFITACSNEEYEVRFDTVGVPYCGVPFYVAGLKILQCQASLHDKGAKGAPKKREIKIEVSFLFTVSNVVLHVIKSYSLGPCFNILSDFFLNESISYYMMCLAIVIGNGT